MKTNWKAHVPDLCPFARPRLAAQGGFSLMELMVVVSILILLAGFLIAALPGVQNRVNRNKVELFMGQLKGGLSKYQQDHGVYPPNEGSGTPPNDATGLAGAQVLYKYLSGDWDEDGAVDEDETIYVEKLDYDSNLDANEKRSEVYGGAYAVIDSFGNPVRYVASPPNVPVNERGTINPHYDLWSIADTDPEDSSSDAQARHITNWQAQ